MKRTHVVLPADLLKDIDSLVGKRGRSSFIAELADREVRKRKLLVFLRRPGPFWKLEDHPELKDGARSWVRKMRDEDEAARQKKLRRR